MELTELITTVKLCQQGQRSAFHALFNHYQPRLTYFVRRLDASGHIDDILQDVWLTVINEINSLKVPQAFPVWLYRIARNKTYDGFRNKDPFVSLPLDGDLPETIDDSPEFDHNDAAALHEGLTKLKPHHRDVLTLYYLEQLPYQAIAEIHQCSIGTVRSRIFYAKRALRNEMEVHNEK